MIRQISDGQKLTEKVITNSSTTVIFSRVASHYIQRKRILIQTCRLVHLSVSLCGGCTVAKRLIGSGCRLEWWMGSVEGWMGVLDRVEIFEGEGAVWGLTWGISL